MRLAVLGSGSGGNCLVVEAPWARIVVDAGFSARELERRLQKIAVDPSTLDALLLTHEHADHVRGAERFCRRHQIPIYATEGTLDESRLNSGTVQTHVVRSGEPLEVASFEVEAFAVPHDAREPVGFVLQDWQGHRLGVVADLGSCSRLAWARLRDLDVLVLEANHDLDMLRNGPYPWHIKQRVASRHGHLSNREAAEGVPELVNDRLQHVVLYHLSRTNNLPELALDAVGTELEKCGSTAQAWVSEQAHPTPWLEVSR
jgi:phosphoribosyl 1,2-cyclic phosphodiesterase